jgi:hypothetical protein
VTTSIARLGYVALAGTALASAAACSKKDAPPPAETSTTTAPAPEPPAQPVFMVVGVDVGRRIDADKKVTDPATTFGRRDTIYASVNTVGATSDAKIAAKWTFQTGQVVDSSEQAVSSTGPAHTEFHISKRTPWPAGKYRLEIFVNGTSNSVKEIEVK